MEVVKVACQKEKWHQNLLKVRFWEPQENALRMKEKVERRSDRIPDVRHPGGMSENFRPGGMMTEKISGCDTSG